MSLLPAMILYLAVGCGEWYLALRRTLACARGEKVVLVCIVFVENLLGLWVLSNFIRTNNWLLAFCYAAGASAGALIVAINSPDKAAQSVPRKTSRSASRARTRPRLAMAGVSQRVLQTPGHARHLPLRPTSRRIECPD
jgi:hypothetical protein